ncbi:MAG: alpha/beta hydrolase [Nitriliruptor sp.]|uniref:alpha/beta hydrolase family protein n=1 Tax=Nitriliruptor sp. TaxID=2448056 RepID=UPI00349FDC68
MRSDANRGRLDARPTALLVIAVVLAACTLPGGAPDAPADEAAVGAEGQGRTIAYGDGPEQVADLALPAGSAPDAGWPTVVLVHGGFWRDQYRRDLMADLARDLANRGFASWNLEYRRVGPTGGGFPGTLLDVAAGTDHLAAVAEEAPIDLDRVAVVGHSAGGHLALWFGSRGRLPAGAPGASDPLRPCAVVAQAPVASLVDAVPLGDGAVTDFLGGEPDEVADRYAIADPMALVGHGVPVLLVHGRSDETVPVDQSERYEAAASAAGDPVELVTGAGDHFAVIDPGDPLWDAQVGFLERHC